MSNRTTPTRPSHSATDAATAPSLGDGGFDLGLRDGRAVRIRALLPSDEGELLQAFGRMSDDARYMRFMRVVREPNLQRLRAVLGSFPQRGIGIVATVAAADGIDIVGSAIAVFSDDGRGCEFATTVAAAFGGVGLATALMNTLIGEARRRGVLEMEGFVLTVNQPMLRLARRLGFSIMPDPDDALLRVCRLRLGAVQAPGGAAGPEVAPA
jgi:acetyltransferase